MTMVTANPGGRGRPASASPEQVLAAAQAQYQNLERLDVRAIAAELGLSRATIYRWFGSREELLAEVLLGEFQAVMRETRPAPGRRGGARILATIDAINQGLAENPAFRAYIEQGPTAVAFITASNGLVQPRVVAALEALIVRVVQEDGYDSSVEPRILAYALIRLSEAFLYNDHGAGMRGEVESLRTIQAALLGVPSTRRRRPIR